MSYSLNACQGETLKLHPSDIRCLIRCDIQRGDYHSEFGQDPRASSVGPLRGTAQRSVIYDESDYGRTTDYTVPPPPPALSEQDKAWLAMQLVAAGLRA